MHRGRWNSNKLTKVSLYFGTPASGFAVVLQEDLPKTTTGDNEISINAVSLLISLDGRTILSSQLPRLNVT